MLIEYEANARQLYARQRLTFDASVRIVGRDNEEWQLGIAALLATADGIVCEGLRSGLPRQPS